MSVLRQEAAEEMVTKLQVTGPPPVPLEVVIAMLRKGAASGVPVRLSPLLARRIAAELEGKQEAARK